VSAITLPGAIPGLLRRGSPAAWVSPLWHPILVTRLDTSPLREPCCWVLDGEREQRATLAEVALDLTDATGRAHAAWWLAERFRERLPLYGALGTPLAAPGVLWRPGVADEAWVLGTWNSNYEAWFTVPGNSYATTVAVVEPLVGLDIRDRTLLPDGSRWVDAEALRRVVLHVAGVTS
jgi:hypothetical protein